MFKVKMRLTDPVEIAKALRDVAQKIEAGVPQGKVLSPAGLVVGGFGLSKDE